MTHAGGKKKPKHDDNNDSEKTPPSAAAFAVSWHLLLSFLFPELDALLLSPAPHLLWVQCFVLVAVHPVVIFGRTG